jgi:hypothetical protein
MNHFLEIASGQIVGLEVVAGHVGQTGFMSLNHGLYDFCYGHFTDAHEHQLHH